MMPGRLIALGSFTLLVLAPATLAAEPQGTTLPWNTLRCHFAYATTEIPAARLDDRVPPNWRLYGANPATANVVTGLTFEADACEEGSGLAGQLAPMDYASTWAPVIPPPIYHPGIFTVLAWDVLVPDDDRRAALAAGGASVRDGSVSFGVDLTAGMPLAPFAVETVLDGAGTIRFDIMTVRDNGDPNPGEFAQYTLGASAPGPYWRTFWDASQSYQGVGTVTLPEGSWQAEALGSTVVPARFNFGIWDYYDGKIVIPS